MPVYILPAAAVITFIIAGCLAKNRKKKALSEISTARKIIDIVCFAITVILIATTAHISQEPSVADKSGIKILSTEVSEKDVRYRTGKELGVRLSDDMSFFNTKNDGLSITYTDSIYNKKTLYQNDVINVQKDSDLKSGYIKINSCLTKCRTGKFYHYAIKYMIFLPEG